MELKLYLCKGQTLVVINQTDHTVPWLEQYWILRLFIGWYPHPLPCTSSQLESGSKWGSIYLLIFPPPLLIYKMISIHCGLAGCSRVILGHYQGADSCSSINKQRCTGAGPVHMVWKIKWNKRKTFVIIFGVCEDNRLQSNFMCCMALFFKKKIIISRNILFCWKSWFTVWIGREGGGLYLQQLGLFSTSALVTGPTLAKAWLLDHGGQWNLCLLIVSNTVGHRMQILASQASPLPAPAPWPSSLHEGMAGGQGTYNVDLGALSLRMLVGIVPILFL